ncbi:MAG: glycosyltransferase family 9 protein [Candidatus Dormibacteria bacterium]|jgi:ADP-heptose:LPS heptosyltransferase
MHVLILVPGRQVETLQASPLVRTVAAGFPEARITLACSPNAARVARGLEEVQEVLPLRGLDPEGPLLAWTVAWARLRHRRFDVAFVCGTTPTTRLLAYLAGVPRRLGPGGGLTTVLLTGRVHAERGENRAATWLRLARLAGVHAERHLPRFEPGQVAAQQALIQLHSTGIGDGRLIVAMAPGWGHSDVSGLDPSLTAWEPERWAHLANQLGARHGAGVIFVGAADDQAAVHAAAADMSVPHADVTGQLDTAAVAALFRLCDLLVSGDSPLLHLAAGVGTPTVGLFGPTDGRRRGPYGGEHRVVQALPPPGRRQDWPDQALMDRIRVDDVLAGIEYPV